MFPRTRSSSSITASTSSTISVVCSGVGDTGTPPLSSE